MRFVTCVWILFFFSILFFSFHFLFLSLTKILILAFLVSLYIIFSFVLLIHLTYEFRFVRQRIFPIPPSVSCSLLLRLSTLKNTALLRSELTGPSYTCINMFGEAKYYFLLIFFFISVYFIFSAYLVLCLISLSFNRRDLRVKILCL